MKIINISERIMKMYWIKKSIFFSKYQMVKISAKTWDENCIHRILVTKIKLIPIKV